MPYVSGGFGVVSVHVYDWDGRSCWRWSKLKLVTVAGSSILYSATASGAYYSLRKYRGILPSIVRVVELMNGSRLVCSYSNLPD